MRVTYWWYREVGCRRRNLPGGETDHGPFLIGQQECALIKRQNKLADGKPGKVGFHSEALGLLGVVPAPDPAAVNHLDKFECQRGVTLPASVREWYSLLGVQDRPEFRHQESTWGPDDFGEYNWGDDPEGEAWLNEEGPLFDPIEKRSLLPVLLGDRYWAVRLDDGDDPSVVTAWDAFSSTVDWEPGAASFSEFVYTRIWDYCFINQSFQAHLEIELRELADLTELGRHWQPRPTTQSGNCRRFAAADDSQRILLRNSVIGSGCGRSIMRCWLWAITEDRLSELSTQIRKVLTEPLSS
ncbi:hypothetical protein ACIHFC_35730 [Streptomyces sp. NPDC052013]|uniref:hypothetical protein n=1 Tax=Streptomyces sp. NPDC052013 TaxID=3365679 RepID=UPI0037D4C4E9